MTLIVFLQFIALGLLLLLSSFFSSSEAALFSIPKLSVKRWIDEGKSRARTLSSILSQPHKVLVTLLLGNTLVNVGASLFATLLFLRLCQITGLGADLGMGLAIGVMTFVLLVFGELTPKVYSLGHAETLSLRLAPLIRFFMRVLSPFTWLLNLLTRGVSSILKTDAQLITLDELRTMVELSEKSGALKRSEARLLGSLFSFGKTTVKEVMTPRTEMTCFTRGLTVGDAVDSLRRAPHSRIPVYEETVDNIAGVLYAKDLLPHLSNKEKPIDKLLREPYFVPEQLNIGELLSEFRKRQVHVAVVVDEYGGTSGLVTLDDILEEVVGEILDEHDLREEPIYQVTGAGEIKARGRMDLDDLNSLMEIELPTEEYDTLGGLIYSLLGRIPGEGEVFSYGGVIFTIEEVRGTRIERVKVKRMAGS